MGLLVLMGMFALCVVVGVPVAFALGVAAFQRLLMKVCL